MLLNMIFTVGVLPILNIQLAHARRAETVAFSCLV